MEEDVKTMWEKQIWSKIEVTNEVNPPINYSQFHKLDGCCKGWSGDGIQWSWIIELDWEMVTKINRKSGSKLSIAIYELMIADISKYIHGLLSTSLNIF